MGKKKSQHTTSHQRIKEKNQKNEVSSSNSNIICSQSEISVENLVNALRYSRYVQMLLLLTLVGIILRFYHLDYNSLWLDEGTTYIYSQLSFVELWDLSVIGEFHPPLFYWIEHFMLYFGDTEFILRFAPALFGSLVIPVFYFIGKELYSKEVGILSAALVVFSPFQVYYSQDARSYTLMLFVFSLAFLFYLKAMNSDRLNDWIFFGILAAIALWAHYYTLIGTGIMVVYTLYIKHKSILKDFRTQRNFFYGIFAFILISLPLMIVLLSRFFVLSSHAPTYGVLGIDLLFESFVRFSGFSVTIALLFIFLFIIGILSYYRINKSNALFIVILLILPIFVSIYLSSKIPMNPRYLIFLLPVFYSGIALSYISIATIAGRFKNNPLLVTVLVIIIALISVPYFIDYYSSYSKNDWRGYSSEIQRISSENDVIVLVPEYMENPFDYYYSNISDNTIEIGASNSADLIKINEIYPMQKKIYIVTTDIFAQNPEGDAIEWLEQNNDYLGQYMGIYTFTSKN